MFIVCEVHSTVVSSTFADTNYRTDCKLYRESVKLEISCCTRKFKNCTMISISSFLIIYGTLPERFSKTLFVHFLLQFTFENWNKILLVVIFWFYVSSSNIFPNFVSFWKSANCNTRVNFSEERFTHAFSVYFGVKPKHPINWVG